MAEVTEIFKGVVDVQVSGVDNAIKSLNNLLDVVTKIQKIGDVKVKVDVDDSRLQSFKNRVDELNTVIGKSGSLAGRGQFRNSIRDMEAFAVTFRDTFRDMKSTADDSATQAAAIIGTSTDEIVKLFKRLEKAGSPVFDSLVDSAQSAADKIVFKSIVPDMIEDIQQEFRLLPPTFEKATREMQQKFLVLKNQFARGIIDEDFVKVVDAQNKIELLRRDLARLGNISRTALDGFDNVDLAKKLGINEALFEIESGVRRLTNKTTPEVLQFRDDLIKVRQAFRDLGKDGGSTVTEVANAVIKLSDAFKPIQEADIAAGLQKSLDKAERSLQQSITKQSEARRNALIRQAAQEAASLQRQEAIDAKKAASIASVTNAIAKIEAASIKSATRTERVFGTGTVRVFRGLSLAIREPELRLQGLREALGGTGAATNIFVRRLDKAIQQSDKLGEINNRLVKSASQLSNEVARTTGALKNQANEFRKLTQIELGNVNASEELNKRLTKVRSAFDQVVVTAESGGDISRSLIRARQEVRQLENEYQLLKKSGIIPAGSASDEAFQAIVRQARNAEAALQGISQRYQASRVEAEKLQQAEAESAQETKQHESILSRLKNLFFRTSTEADNVHASSVRLTQELKQSEQVSAGLLSNAKAIAGVFSAGLVGAGIGGLVGGLTGGLIGGSGIGDIVTLSASIQGEARRIAASVGESADSVTGFGDIIRNVYADNFGQNIAQVGEFVQETNLSLQRFGDVSDEVITNAVENSIRLTDTFKDIGDSNEIADAVSALFANFDDIASIEDAYDFIAAGAQKGLNTNRDFLDTIREYSTQFRDAGADASFFFNLLDTGFSGGVLGTDKVIDLFKEFRIRILDGSKLTEDSLKRLGINSQDLLTRLSDGEISIAQAFQFVTEKLRETDSELIRQTSGVGLLGTQYEDLGATATSNLSVTGTTIEQIRGSVKSLDVQYNTLGNTIEQIGRNFLLAFDLGTILGVANRLLVPFIGLSTQIGSLFSLIIDPIDRVTLAFETFVNNIIYGSDEITGVFGNFVAAIVSVMQGDFSLALDFGVQAVVSLLQNISGLFNSYIGEAHNWGYGLMIQVGNGIIDAANSVLDAVAQIAEAIASYLRPGSPPKQGPLSDIDEWGSGLARTFSDGFSSSDFDFLADLLDPVADALSGEADKFGVVRGEIEKIIAGINDTGRLDLDAFENIEKVIGDSKVTNELKRQLESRQKLTSATKEVEKLEAKARKEAESGFITAETKQALAAAKAKVEGAQQEVKANDERQRAIERIARLEEEVAKKDDDEKKVLAETGALAAAVGAQRRDELEKTKKTAADAYQQELSDIETLYESGAITQEEYIKKKLGAEEKYFRSVDNYDKAGSAQRIKRLKAELDTVEKETDRVAKGLRGGILGGATEGTALFDPANFLPKPKDINASVTSFVTETGKSIVDGLKSRITSGASEFGTGLKDLVIGGLSQLRAFVKSIPTELVFPFITFIGSFTSPIVYGAFNLLDEFFLLFTKIGPAIRALATFIKPILSLTLRWSVAGLVVYGIIFKWDHVMEVLTEVIDSVKISMSNLIDNAVEIFSVMREDGTLGRTVINFALGLSTLGLAASQVAGLFFTITKKALKIAIIEGFGGAVGVINKFIDAFGGAREFALSFGPAIEEISEAFRVFITLISAVISNLTAGDIPRALVLFVAIPRVISEIFSDGAVLGFFAKIGSALAKVGSDIINLLPQGFQETITQITSSFQGFFNEGQLGGEIMLALYDIFNLLYAIIVDLKDVWIILGAIIGAIVVVAINLVISALQALVDIIPNILGVLTGLVQIFRGIIQAVTGVIQFIGALGAAIIGVFTGDFSNASALFLASWENMRQGVLLILEGFTQAAVNAFLGLFTFVSSLIENFVGNVLRFLDEGSLPWLETFRTRIAGITDIFQTLTEIVPKIISGLFDQLSTIVETGINRLLEWFSYWYDRVIGNSIIPDLVNDVVDYVATLPDQLIGIISGMVTTLVDKALELGTSFINALKQGLSLGGIGETIAGLFSGGTEGGTAGVGLLSQIFGGGEASGVALQEVNAQFTQFSLFFQEIITLMTETWNLFINETFLFGWTNAIFLITESLTVFNVFFQTTILGFQVQWQLFMQQVVSIFTQSVATMQEVFTSFVNTAIELIMALMAVIEELIKTFEKAASAAKKMGDKIVEAAKKSKDGLQQLKPVLEQLIKLFEKLEAAARRAANAAKDVGAASGGGGPSAQGGAYRTYEGMWHLHDDEMVLPAPIASGFRNLLSLLTSSGIHGVSLASLPTGNPRPLSTDDVGSGANLPQITFENHIYNDMDVNRLNQQIIDTVTRLI